MPFFERRFAQNVFFAHTADHGAFGGASRRGQQLFFDHREGGFDVVKFFDITYGAGIIVKRLSGGGNDADVAVDAQNARQQLGPKAVHYRHHDNQGGHPERNSGKSKAGNNGNKAFFAFGPEITAGQQSFKLVKDHEQVLLIIFKVISSGRIKCNTNCSVCRYLSKKLLQNGNLWYIPKSILKDARAKGMPVYRLLNPSKLLERK